MTLLQRVWAMHRAEYERQRFEAREGLREILKRNVPSGTKVYLFGSITRPGDFTPSSDIDIGVEGLSESERSIIGTAIEEGLLREVDILDITSSRLGPKLVATGELWIM